MDAKRVFVNCPFDKAYKPLFDAAIFAIHDLGFEARHALIDNSSAIRLQRISSEIQGSKFSIHDISRVERSGALRLPRFNMPFEAGMAYLLHEVSEASNKHHLLLLDAEPYRYHASLSDACGFDAKIHNGKPERIIDAIRTFLMARGDSSAGSPQGGKVIWKRFNLFKTLLARAARQKNLSISELKSWSYVNDLQRMMVDWMRDNPP